MIEQQIFLPCMQIAQKVAASIAPAWPLDQSIAVNPWWQQRHQSIEQTFIEQTLISGETGLMEKSYYRQLWDNQIQSQHLQQAIDELNSPLTVAQLKEDIQRSNSNPNLGWQTLAILMDKMIPSPQGHSWSAEIVQQVSQFIALYHQYPERFAAKGKDGNYLYQSWLQVVGHDKGIKTLLGVDLLDYFQALPTNVADLCEEAGSHWQPAWKNQSGASVFIKASLHQLSGWAGWQAWLDWQADLVEQPADVSHALGLTSILLAWDTVLMQWLEQEHASVAAKIQRAIVRQVENLDVSYQQAAQDVAALWVWQRALEISVSQPWIEQIKSVENAKEEDRPELQAIFCIDVRSEPMRRALEAQSPHIETLGFAGFFGLPIAYENHDGSMHRPQLPGLLAPYLVAKQTQKPPERFLRMTKLGWYNSLEKPASTLGMVEAGGLLKLVDLFKRVILQQGSDNPVNQDLRDNREWQLTRDQQPLTVREKAELAAGILKAMGISQRLAKSVLLTGHGSQTCNNHTASGLDCGACGGQSGEVNVKVLASLLNDADVRAAMSEFGVVVPDDTQFYAAIHNTTQDKITVFDGPESEWRNWIYEACQQARQNRSNQFAEPAPDFADMNRFFNQRATNWAQMRPEWGLCNNAGVFIAPRSLTRNLDFSGRAFLHEYHAELDPEFAQLEKIMTAPLLVMNWINMQYYASVAVPEKYGSGNKLLHNVVGGHIGVFEGNGGDLRIGLSKQSVHDGSEYRHQPVRLNAFIQAPKETIESIMARHQNVADLVNNKWLFIYQLDEQQQVWQYQNGEWVAK